MRLLVRREFIATLFVGCVSVGLVRGDGFSGQRTADDLERAGFVALFDGQTLGEWNVEPQHEGHWVVRDGVIHYDGQSTGKWHERSLWTNKSFGDFEMYVEWRLPAEPELKAHPIVLYSGDFLMQEENPGKRVTRMRLDAGDSGLYFRGSTKCQANVWSQELGSGEINGYRTDKKMPAETRRACIPMRNADRPLGQWNAFLITIKGEEMTVMLNGMKVIDSAYLPDLPATGPIALQHHGDLVQFRQLWIREL